VSRPGAELAQVLAGSGLLVVGDSALRAVGPGLPGPLAAALVRWAVADVLPPVEWLTLVCVLLAALRYAGALRVNDARRR